MPYHNPFADLAKGRQKKTGSRKKADEPEFFSFDEWTANLDAETLAERIDAESSLYRWVQVVLGYKELPETCDYRLYEPVHRPMCDDAERVLPIRGRERDDTTRKLLDLEPRGSLKTNVETIGTALYYLVFNYNARILISSHLHKAAKEMLGVIMWNIEFNETFKRFYGDWAYYAKRYGTWRDDAFELAFRTLGLREPTVDTCGAEISKTGGHYDVILVDDIQSRENVRSRTERESVQARIQEYFPQLQPYGGMIVVGTRYHRQDVYSWIMHRNEQALKNKANPEWLFKVKVRSAWNNDGTLYYPTRLTANHLAQKAIELEDYLFAVWYRNEPIDEATKVFVNPRGREVDFDFVGDAMPYIVRPNGERRSVFTTLAWDPAGRESTNKDTDFHGITTAGTDSAGVRWMLRALELKLPLDALLDRICTILKADAVMKMSIETRGAGMQGLWVDLLRPVMERAGLGWIPIVEWSPGNVQSKDARIRAQQPRYKQGRLWFRKGYCDALVQQMDDFPQLEHDDVVDTLPQHETIGRPAEPDDVAGGGVREEDFDAPAEDGRDQVWVSASIGVGTPDYDKAVA